MGSNENTRDAVGESPVSAFLRPPVLLSALLIVAIVAVGVWVIAVTGQGAQNSAPPAPLPSDVTAGDAADPSSVEVAGDSVCGLVAHDVAAPEFSLLSVPVEVGRSLTVPSIEGVGPGVVRGVSHCFAHSPVGAVLAAANFMVWFSSMQQLDDVIDQLMVAGPDRDHLADQVAAQWSGQTGSAVTIHAYTFESRGDDDVVVTFAVSRVGFPDDLVAWPLRLSWSEGDWKVVVPSNAAWGERSIVSLRAEGFIDWRP